MKKLTAFLIILLLTTSCNFPGLGIKQPVSEGVVFGDGGKTCNNLLYPLIPGNQWIYRISSASSTNQVGITVATVEGSQATVDMLDVNTGVVTRTTADCAGTAITNFPLMTIKLIVGNYLNGELELEHLSGVFAPQNAELEDGDAGWEGNFIAHGSVSAQDTEGNIKVTVEESPVELKFQTLGYEAVSVPAGTFSHALKVQRDMIVDVKIEAEGMTLDGTIQIRSTQWFEPGVGLLKTTVDEGNLVFLLGTYPIGLTGSLELMEARPAE